MYLINSPVVRAESLRFVKQGVSDTVRKVLLPWYNSCSFFEQCITRLRKDGKDFEASAYTNFKTDNKFDCWIRSSYNSLVKFVRKELGEGYRLYTVVRGFLSLQYFTYTEFERHFLMEYHSNAHSNVTKTQTPTLEHRYNEGNGEDVFHRDRYA